MILLTDTRTDPHPRKYFIKTAKKHAELHVTDRQTDRRTAISKDNGTDRLRSGGLMGPYPRLELSISKRHDD